MVGMKKLSVALAVMLVCADPALAVPKASPEGEAGEGASVSVGGPTLGDAAPVLQDGSPTLELSAPATSVSPGQSLNPLVGAAALSPDRCAVEVELPSDGAEVTIPKPVAEGSEKDCVALVDAQPTMMTNTGPQPILGDGTGSTTEGELLLRLGERKSGLDQEKASLDQQARLLDAAEKRIAERTAALTALEASINQLVGARDQQSEEQVAEMVSLYQNMKPKEAAWVLGGLPDPVLLKIASAMSPRKMSAIMAELEPARAQVLTIMMMDQATKLPD